jgi:hypothetical protein
MFFIYYCDKEYNKVTSRFTSQVISSPIFRFLHPNPLTFSALLRPPCILHNRVEGLTSIGMIEEYATPMYM